MEIQCKGDRWPQVKDVATGHVDGMFGWIKKYDDRTVFYPSTHWEPVEEWVDIQVRKEDWDRVSTGHLAVVTSAIGVRPAKWRYPQ